MAAARTGVERWQQSKDEGAELLENHQSDEWEGFPEPVFLLYSLQYVTV